MPRLRLALRFLIAVELLSLPYEPSRAATAGEPAFCLGSTAFLHPSAVKSLKVGAGNVLYTASYEGLYRWDLATGASAPVGSKYGQVGLMAVSPDASMLLTSTTRGVVVSTADKGEIIKQFKFESGMSGLEFSPDGKGIVTCAMGELQHTPFDGDTQSFGKCKALIRPFFSKDCKIALVPAVSGADRSNAVDVYDVLQLKKIATLETGPTPPENARNSLWAAISPDGRFAAICTDSGPIKLWDVSARKPVREFKSPGSRPLDWDYRALLFSDDGKILFAASANGSIYSWDTASGEGLETFRGNDDTINTLSLGDGELISGSEKGGISIRIAKFHCPQSIRERFILIYRLTQDPRYFSTRQGGWTCGT